MILIVPLAGPDFVLFGGLIKCFLPFRGKPLIQSILLQRQYEKYLSPGETLQTIFVFQEKAPTAEVKNLLRSQFPNPQFATVSEVTRGALMSTLAGFSLVARFSEPVIVDLVDIGFSWPQNPFALFESPQVGGVLPLFTSQDPIFSYAHIEEGRVVRTEEKNVISNQASAGVYIFRNASVFLRAAAHSLENPHLFHKSMAFLCPSFNGILAQGLDVVPVSLKNVEAYLGKSTAT